MLALDIGRSGVIEIHDGPTIESPLLATFPTQENVQLIISTQQYMTVYFNSLSDFKGAGFEFSYVQGTRFTCLSIKLLHKMLHFSGYCRFIFRPVL